MNLTIVKNIVGEKIFAKIRSFGYRWSKRLHTPFTEESFKNFLTYELGIKEGDSIFIHSSVDKLNFSFPVHNIISLLQEIVGEQGTILFPCWHFTERAEDYLIREDSLFNVKRSPSVMGLLPELARRNKNAQRSLHPTSSVVAIGSKAHEMIKDHHSSQYPCDSHSPFYKIMHYNGKIIGLGEKPEHSMSFVHCVEDEMKEKFPVKTRTDEVYKSKVIDYDGSELFVKTRAAHKNIQKRNVKRYLDRYVNSDECKTLRKNGSWFFVADAGKLYQKMENLALQGKTIYF